MSAGCRHKLFLRFRRNIYIIFSSLVYIVRRSSIYRSRAAYHREKRVSLMSNIIKRIEDIKVFCMEQVYAMMIKDRRNREIDMMRGSLYLRATSISLHFVLKLSIFVGIVSVLNMNKYLSANSVYVIISYYTMLFTSMLQFWPHLVMHANDSYKAVKKIQNLLIEDDTTVEKQKRKGSKEVLLKEQEKSLRVINEVSEIKSISIRDIQVTNETLKCDNIEINEQKCYVIIGDSTLPSFFIQLLLGEAEMKNGKIEINGSISYATQNGWIFPGSIRENIVFTEKFDNDRYMNILKMTQIDKDIETLPIGDDTFVDEFSANEIFKARINLARCIYRESDIYLLDNCFEKFNDETSRSLFKDIAKNFLKVQPHTHRCLTCTKLFFSNILYPPQDKIVISSTGSYYVLREADIIIAINDNKVHLGGSLRDFRRTNLFERLIPKSDVQDAEENSMKIFERTNSTDSSQVDIN